MGTPQPPSKITQWPIATDPAVVQDTTYRMTPVDRAYIDSQARGAQQHIVDSLVSGFNATWATLDQTSAAGAIGDVVCLVGVNVTRAVAAALALAGGPCGILVSAAAPGMPVRIALTGIIPTTVTGLGATIGGRVLARVNTTTARVEAVSTIGGSDYALGTVEASGNLSLRIQLPPSTSGGNGNQGQQNVTLSNGLNSNVSTTGLSFLRIGGPTAAFSIGGFSTTAGTKAGLPLSGINTTAFPMTIVEEDASSTAANRINLGRNTGLSVATAPLVIAPNGGTFTVTYDTTASRWYVTAGGPKRDMSATAPDFGAQGDAVADDTAALQNIITYAGAGVETRLPGGRFVISSPLFVRNSGSRIRGEYPYIAGVTGNGATSGHPVTNIITVSNTFPVFVLSPTIIVPTYAADPSHSGLHMCDMDTALFNGVPQGFISWSMTDAANIHGLSAFSLEFYINAPSAITVSVAVINSWGRRPGGAAAAGALQFNLVAGHGTNTQPDIVLTTSNGTFAINGAAFPSLPGLTANVTHLVELSYDGSNLRLFVDGTQTGIIAATGTIVQGAWEDFLIGAQSIGWPQSKISIYHAGQYKIGGIRTSKVARHTANYSAAYADQAYDSNTLLITNFNTAPTNATGQATGAGTFQEWLVCQSGTLFPNGSGRGGNVVWYRWQQLSVGAITDCHVSDIGTNGAADCIYAVSANHLVVERMFHTSSLGTGRGFFVTENSFTTKFSHCYTLGSITLAQTGGWHGFAFMSWKSGVMNLEYCYTTGGRYFAIGTAGSSKNCTFLAAGLGMLYLNNEGQGGASWNSYFDSFGDEGSAGFSDCMFYLVNMSAFLVYGSGMVCDNGASTGPIAKIVSGGSYHLEGSFGGTSGSAGIVQFLNDASLPNLPTQAVHIDVADQVGSFGTAPWVDPAHSGPLVVTEQEAFGQGPIHMTADADYTMADNEPRWGLVQVDTVLAGTVTVSASTTVLFQKPQTLAPGTQLVFSIDGTHTVYSLNGSGMSAATTGTLTASYTGTTGSTGTASINLTVPRNVKLPCRNIGKRTKVINATTGSQAITWEGLTGTGVSITTKADVFDDGTNVVAK